MDDLRARFGTLDRLPAPDLWSDVERRLQALGRATPTKHLVAVTPGFRRAIGDASGSVSERRDRRRVAVLLAAALMAALLIGGMLAVGSGLVRLSSVLPPFPSREATLATSPSPLSSETTPSPTPSGLLGGGPILAQSWKSLYDRGQHDVVAIDAGTGEQTLLGTLPGGVVNPYWFQQSADGSHAVVLNSGMDGAQSLVSPTASSRSFGFIDAGGINLACCKGGYTESMALSPHGDRIAAVHADGFENKIEVVILDVTGGGFKRLPLPRAMSFLGGLSWAPDESALVAYGCRPCNAATSPTERQTPEHVHLYVIPLDGAPWRELLDVNNGQVNAMWSPDSKTLVTGTWICPSGSYMPRCDPATSKTSLGTVPVAGGVPTTFGEVPGLFSMTWSPDGQRIAYRADDGIYVVNAAGTDRVRVSDADSDRVAWSPDGQWLLFERVPSELWIVSAAGGLPRRVATSDAGAAW